MGARTDTPKTLDTDSEKILHVSGVAKLSGWCTKKSTDCKPCARHALSR